MDQSDSGQATEVGGLHARFVRGCAERPWLVVGLFVLAFAGLILGTATLSGNFNDEFELPGSDIQRAADLLEEKFPGQEGDSLRLVFAAPEGESLDTPARREAIDDIAAIGAGLEFAERTTTPFDEGSGGLAQSGRIGFADVQFAKSGFELEREAIEEFQDEAREIAEPAGLQVEFTGSAEAPPPEQGTSELIGLLVAMIVLALLFRALIPTFLPLLFAILAVAAAFMLLYIGTRFFDFNSITPILVSMIGIGVGIDYSLFIITRFRQFLHDGHPPREASALAAATSGRAVIFAGLTVAIAILGLFTIGLAFITALGIGASLGVLTAVVFANTLLPAVLSLVGHKIDFASVRADDSSASRDRSLFAKWGRFVTRYAAVLLPVAILLALLIASPGLSVRLGLGDAGTAPTDQTTRKAYDLLSSKDGFGPGSTAPLIVVVDESDDPGATGRVVDALREKQNDPDGRIEFVADPFFNPGDDVAIINVTSAFAPREAGTDDLVADLRDSVLPGVLEGSNGVAYVTGANAAFTDIGDRILSRLPWFLLFVIGVTILVITMAFRSLFIAVKAAITTLLSALVGFGALVFTFQLGNGLGLVGLDRTGPIESFVPPIAFAILFGLAMDYEVFLMSRIREEKVRGAAAVNAVTQGIAGVGRVVVAAALIMASVFFAFVLGEDRVSKEFGFLLGVAILTDALLVRMTLVPALLALVKERAWGLPGWLDRLLPNLTVEPPTLPSERGTEGGG